MSLKKLDSININVPNSTEYVQLLRLTVSGLASQLNFPLEDINKIKFIISAICQYINKQCKAQRIDMDFNVYENKLSLSFNNVCAAVKMDKKKLAKLMTTLEINKYMDKVKVGNKLLLEKKAH